MALVDLRITKTAEVLVKHSVKVKKGDRVMIVADILAKPLVLEIFRLCVLAGAKIIRTNFDSYEFAEIFYKNAKEWQITTFPKVALDEIKQVDCYFAIRASLNTRGLTSVNPFLISERSKVVRPIIDWRVEKTRWVIANFPCEAFAQEADMSLGDYEDFVFRAVNGVDWKKKFSEQEKLRSRIDKTKKVRIITPDTDLRLDISGRRAENGGGQFNMPDGEVFTSVVENSASGHIKYSFPAIYMGREFHEVLLEFKKGKVVRARAAKGEADLNKILDMDKGSRYIGELGIGNNFKIKKFSKDILFDEKIGGTIHLALGKGYKETLSKNESALHWDMICDLRQNSELWFDDKLVQKGGKWLI